MPSGTSYVLAREVANITSSLLSGIFFSHNSATDGKCFNYYKHGLTHLERMVETFLAIMCL